MTPSRCTPLAFGLLHLGPTSSLVSGIAAWRSARLAGGPIKARLGARPDPCFGSCRSSCSLLARAVQRLDMVEL